MPSGDELFKILRCSELDQAEFEQLVSSYFGHGSQLGDEEISYARAYGGSALRLIYDQNGLLKDALAGPDLEPEHVPQLQAEIETKLLTVGPFKIRKRVLFTSVPTTGWFRYLDKFQILPIPSVAPKPPYFLATHPLMLEFKYPSSSDFMISNLRQGKIGRELELVCSSLLTFRIQSIGSETQSHWVFEPFEDGKKFFALSPEDRDRFLRASYWFQLAADIFSRSKSAAFVALVSAIEAFIPGEYQRTQKFADFVEANLPGTHIPEAERKRFYRLRSNLSHGGGLLSGDHGSWGFTQKGISEGNDMSAVWQTVQVVLHNWLLKK